nr:hypothetical protein [Tanacetum cinerariifolium]
MKQIQIFKIIRMQIFKDPVLIVVRSAYNNLSQKGVTVSFKRLDTYDTENPHMRSDCTTIRWGIVSSDA